MRRHTLNSVPVCEWTRKLEKKGKLMRRIFSILMVALMGITAFAGTEWDWKQIIPGMEEPNDFYSVGVDVGQQAAADLPFNYYVYGRADGLYGYAKGTDILVEVSGGITWDEVMYMVTTEGKGMLYPAMLEVPPTEGIVTGMDGIYISSYTQSGYKMITLYSTTSQDYPYINMPIKESADYLGSYSTEDGSMLTQDAEYRPSSAVRINMLSASFELSLDADGDYVAEGEFLGDNNVHYTFHVDKSRTAIHEVQADMKATKMVRDGKIVVIRGGKEYSILGAEL